MKNKILSVKLTIERRRETKLKAKLLIKRKNGHELRQKNSFHFLN
jgi:hypothetical protein